MAWKNPIFKLAALCLGLSVELAVTAGFSFSARASSEVSNPNSVIPQTWQLSQFNPPDRGAPDVAVGGATRSPRDVCGVTPLVPLDSSKDYGDLNPPYFGLTVTERPTFFLHVEKRPVAQEVFFEVYEYNTEGRGKDGQLVYKTSFDVPAAPGIVSTKLPPSAGLEVGKTYRWYLDILCGGNAVEVVSTHGWVERIDATPELSSKLVRAETTEARSGVYAEIGIWFDALNILGQERIAADTQTLKTEWESLLQALNLTDLEGIANAPFMDCCNESVEVFGEDPALTSQN